MRQALVGTLSWGGLGGDHGDVDDGAASTAHTAEPWLSEHGVGRWRRKQGVAR